VSNAFLLLFSARASPVLGSPRGDRALVCPYGDSREQAAVPHRRKIFPQVTAVCRWQAVSQFHPPASLLCDTESQQAQGSLPPKSEARHRTLPEKHGSG